MLNMRLKISVNKKFFFRTIFLLSVFFVFLPGFYLQAFSSIEFLDISEAQIGKDKMKISWKTGQATGGRILLGEKKDDLRHYIDENKAESQWHAVEIGNLSPDTEYFYKIIAFNEFDKAETFIRSFEIDGGGILADAPEITGLEISHISATAAAIKWKTDIAATSYAGYGHTNAYEKRSNSSRKTTEHLVVLKKLEPNSQYFIRVKSKNKDGVESGYRYRQFYTCPAFSRNEEELVISRFRPNSPRDNYISSNIIILGFAANNYSSGRITVRKKGFKTRKIDLEYDTDFYVPLSGLEPDSCYDINISLKDIFNNRYKDDLTFCTLASAGHAPSVSLENQSGNYTRYDLGQKTDPAAAADDSAAPRFPGVSGIYKTKDSPRLWLIANGRRHHINSPQALSDYGYETRDIKVVSWPEIFRYQTARLVKSPDSATVYFLHKKQGYSWSKIALPSSSAFLSYRDNSWDKIITISLYDLDSYEDVKFVRAAGGEGVYFLSQNRKYFISPGFFREYGFSGREILDISRIHLNSYIDAGPYR